MTKLFETCHAGGHRIVVPLTTRLEFERHQRQEMERERREIAKAHDLLTRVGVELDEPNAELLAPMPNLISLIEMSGVDVIEVEPTADELAEAHRRAALHESPHPVEAKSDEMRDLVIWVQCINIARRDSGAMLISNDHLHTGKRGDDEAAEVGLIRIASVDEALEHLHVQSPAEKLIRQLIDASWRTLTEAAPELPASIELTRVEVPFFVRGRRRDSFSANAVIAGSGPEGQKLEAAALFRVTDNALEHAALDMLQIDGAPRDPVRAAPSAEIQIDWAPVGDEELERLRGILRS